MPRFLVESYLAESPAAFDDACDHARLTAEVGAGVRYVDTTYLPGDETIFHLFDAPSTEALEAAGRHAGLRFERIVQAVSESAERKEKGT